MFSSWCINWPPTSQDICMWRLHRSTSEKVEGGDARRWLLQEGRGGCEGAVCAWKTFIFISSFWEACRTPQTTECRKHHAHQLNVYPIEMFVYIHKERHCILSEVKWRFRCYFFRQRFHWNIADSNSFTYPYWYILWLYCHCSLNGLTHRARQQFGPGLIDRMQSNHVSPIVLRKEAPSLCAVLQIRPTETRGCLGLLERVMRTRNQQTSAAKTRLINVCKSEVWVRSQKNKQHDFLYS